MISFLYQTIRLISVWLCVGSNVLTGAARVAVEPTLEHAQYSPPTSSTNTLMLQDLSPGRKLSIKAPKEKKTKPNVLPRKPWYKELIDLVDADSKLTRVDKINKVHEFIEKKSKEFMAKAAAQENSYDLHTLMVHIFSLEEGIEAIYKTYSSLDLNARESTLVDLIYKQLTTVRAFKEDYQERKKSEELILSNDKHAYSLYEELLDAIRWTDVNRVEQCIKKIEEVDFEKKVLMYSYACVEVDEAPKKVKRMGFLEKDMQKVKLLLKHELQKASMQSSLAYTFEEALFTPMVDDAGYISHLINQMAKLDPVFAQQMRIEWEDRLEQLSGEKELALVKMPTTKE